MQEGSREALASLAFIVRWFIIDLFFSLYTNDIYIINTR